MTADNAVWPEYLMIRDTGLHDDSGGLGQRIYTTAGAGYAKVKYVRADIAERDAAEIVRLRGEVEKLEAAAEEIESGHTWITAVAASAIIRKHLRGPSLAPAEAKGDGWEENVRYLLDSYPGSIRVRPGAGPEELIGSLSVTFIKLRDLAMKAPQPADGEAVAPFGWARPSELDKAIRLGEPGARIGVHVSPVRDEECTAPLYTTPPAPVQAAPQEGEKAAATLRDALEYVGYRQDGDLNTLAERAELWMRESKALIDMRQESAAHPSACELVVDDAMVERVCRNHFPDWDMYGPAGKMVRSADIRRLLTAALQHRGDSQEVGRG